MTSLMLEKSVVFSREVLCLCTRLKRDFHEYEIASQLLRSGTSVCANLKEAQYAQSKADFLNKQLIALKECNETELWLDRVADMGYLEDDSIRIYCKELLKMLVASTKTLKRQLGLLE